MFGPKQLCQNSEILLRGPVTFIDVQKKKKCSTLHILQMKSPGQSTILTSSRITDPMMSPTKQQLGNWISFQGKL